MYGVSRGLAEGMLALRGVVLATLLGPSAFGAWSLFRLASRYAALGGLGVHRGLEYEIVRARTVSGDDSSEVDRVGESALGFFLVVFGIAAIGLGAASFLVSDPRLVAGLRALTVGVLAEQLWLYGLATLRARGELRRFAMSEVINAALHLGLGVSLAILFGISGAYLGFLVAAVVSIGLFMRRVPMRPHWSGPRLSRLIQMGLPMALLVLATIVLGTVDRLVVAAFGGTTLLGFYAFAAALSALANTGGWVIRTVVFPSVYRAATGHGALVAVRICISNGPCCPLLFLPRPCSGLPQSFSHPRSWRGCHNTSRPSPRPASSSSLA